jgi:hypothetical protein
MAGKTIRLFLSNGNPIGILSAEIMNWTGSVFSCPRSMLNDLSNREEVKRAGVYVLVGEGESSVERERIYIGESDNVLSRLLQHRRDDFDFWNRAIIITSKDSNLTKAHIRYLESKLIELASTTKRAEIENSTYPSGIYLPESDTADMDFFLEQIQILLPLLGLSFSNPLPDLDNLEKLDKDDKPTIYEITKLGLSAKAIEIGSDFIVLKGSTIRKENTPSLRKSYAEMRKDLIAEGLFVNSENTDFWITSENIIFSSPSYAASIVTGSQQNGRIEWKVEGKQIPYGEWQEQQINF